MFTSVKSRNARGCSQEPEAQLQALTHPEIRSWAAEADAKCHDKISVASTGWPLDCLCDSSGTCFSYEPI